MTATTEQIRNIQAGLGAQGPKWDRAEDGITPAAGAAGVAITTPNGVPTTSTQGSPVAVATGDSGVYSALALKADTLTTADVRWWGYYDGAQQGIAGVTGWYLLAGSEQTITTSWTQLVPTGPVSRLYCEVTAITGASVTPYLGPCDIGSV